MYTQSRRSCLFDTLAFGANEGNRRMGKAMNKAPRGNDIGLYLPRMVVEPISYEAVKLFPVGFPQNPRFPASSVPQV